VEDALGAGVARQDPFIDPPEHIVGIGEMMTVVTVESEGEEVGAFVELASDIGPADPAPEGEVLDIVTVLGLVAFNIVSVLGDADAVIGLQIPVLQKYVVPLMTVVSTDAFAVSEAEGPVRGVTGTSLGGTVPVGPAVSDGFVTGNEIVEFLDEAAGVEVESEIKLELTAAVASIVVPIDMVSVGIMVLFDGKLETADEAMLGVTAGMPVGPTMKVVFDAENHVAVAVGIGEIGPVTPVLTTTVKLPEAENGVVLPVEVVSGAMTEVEFTRIVVTFRPVPELVVGDDRLAVVVAPMSERVEALPESVEAKVADKLAIVEVVTSVAADAVLPFTAELGPGTEGPVVVDDAERTSVPDVDDREPTVTLTLAVSEVAAVAEKDELKMAALVAEVELPAEAVIRLASCSNFE
jgi:hypothetical protein